VATLIHLVNTQPRIQPKTITNPNVTVMTIKHLISAWLLRESWWIWTLALSEPFRS